MFCAALFRILVGSLMLICLRPHSTFQHVSTAFVGTLLSGLQTCQCHDIQLQMVMAIPGRITVADDDSQRLDGLLPALHGL